MQKLFISYSSDDRSFVETEIVPLLKRNGLRPWCADQDIRASENWGRTIREELSTSDWVLVVLSPSSVCSDWVQAEIDLAFRIKHDRVIPLMYRDCDPTELHMKLGLLQYIDCRDRVPSDKVLLEIVWAQEGERNARGEPSPSGSRNSREDTHLSDKETVGVEITIDVPFAEFTDECQRIFSEGIRELLGVDDFIIRARRKGSTKIILELSSETAEQLCREITAGRLAKFRVSGATVLNHLQMGEYLDLELVKEHAFRELIAGRSKRLLTIAAYLSRCHLRRVHLTQAFLGDMLSQAIQLQELLDVYGAEKNDYWCAFRELIASLRVLTEVSYELVYIRHQISGLKLLQVEQDFRSATDEVLEYVGGLLVKAAQKMLEQTHELHVGSPPTEEIGDAVTDDLPTGHLAYDRALRHTGNAVAETASLLATAFINLASESKDVCTASRFKPNERSLLIGASLTEEVFRKLEFQFHNLQSQYDTYISNAMAEVLDSDLPYLRGHISVVLHLLRVAKLLAHYYERHLMKDAHTETWVVSLLVKPETLLSVLIDYAITFIGQYITSATSLCQHILMRYVEVGRIRVPIPQYRGFHVRPSTLVAKLVLHYGSKVVMQLGDETYDASSPLEIFRANEKINAHKRRWLAQEIVRLGLVTEHQSSTDLGAIVRNVTMALAAEGALILYEQPLKLPDHSATEEGTLVERVLSEMGRLLAMGKIDVATDIQVEFVGDKRVLADIECLAEFGYGEDAFGNNVPLHDRLLYLRR